MINHHGDSRRIVIHSRNPVYRGQLITLSPNGAEKRVSTARSSFSVGLRSATRERPSERTRRRSTVDLWNRPICARRCPPSSRPSTATGVPVGRAPAESSRRPNQRSSTTSTRPRGGRDVSRSVRGLRRGASGRRRPARCRTERDRAHPEHDRRDQPRSRAR